MGPKRSHHHKRRRDRVPVGDARVLLVVLKELKTSKVEDVIINVFWVMSQFGLVEKISKFSDEQLLVQFKDSQAAERTMGYLNTRELKCVGVSSELWSCRFAIVPSSVSQLTFKKEDERNSDFTALNERIQSGEETKMYDFLWGEHVKGEGWLMPKQPDDADKGAIPAKREGLPKGEVGVCVYMANLPDITAEQLFRVCGQYGVVVAAKMLQKHSGKALLQFESKGDAEAARKKLDGVPVFGKKLVVKPSPHANAQHWNGLQTEDQPKLYSMEDSPPPEPMKEKAPPSRHVWSAGGGDENENAILLSLVKFRAVHPVMKRNAAHTLLEFPTVEDAFRCISLLNGTPCGLPGSSHNFSMGFVQEPVFVISSPIQNLDLRSATGPSRISTTAQPLPFRVGGQRDTIDKLLTDLNLNEYDYIAKLKSEGYERASDLRGSKPEKLENLGIKAGHVRRMLNAVEDLYVQQYEDDLQAARSQTAPPQHPNFNILTEQVRQHEGRTHTAPFITKSVCIDSYARPLQNVVVPVRVDIEMEDAQRSMTCPTTGGRANGVGNAQLEFVTSSGDVAEEDMQPRTKTCPGNIASRPLFQGTVPSKASEGDAEQTAAVAEVSDIFRTYGIGVANDATMARTKTAPMGEEHPSGLPALDNFNFLIPAELDSEEWNPIRSNTLPGRPR